MVGRVHRNSETLRRIICSAESTLSVNVKNNNTVLEWWAKWYWEHMMIHAINTNCSSIFQWLHAARTLWVRMSIFTFWCWKSHVFFATSTALLHPDWTLNCSVPAQARIRGICNFQVQCFGGIDFRQNDIMNIWCWHRVSRFSQNTLRVDRRSSIIFESDSLQEQNSKS